jgi:hypothetical protein
MTEATTIGRRQLEELIFGAPGEARRHTQDSPVSPDVWIAYWEAPDKPADLLLAATTQHTAAELTVALRSRLGTDRTAKHAVRIAHTASYGAAQLSFDELLWGALPLSKWWTSELQIDPIGGLSAALRSQSADEWADGHSGKGLLWLVDVAGLIAVVAEGKPLRKMPDRTRRRRALLKLLNGRDAVVEYAEDPLLAEVSLNRPASPAVNASRQSVKVDAAERVFAPSCARLGWAVVDSGIDALHPAFRRRDPNGRPLEGKAFEQIADEHLANKLLPVNRTRIVAAYDFSLLRDVQSSALEPGTAHKAPDADMVEIARTLEKGRLVDWELLAPHLEVAHDDDESYIPPVYPHGTHVAGILAGDWRTNEPGLESSDHDLRGMCPDL